MLSVRDRITENNDLVKKPDEIVEAVENRLRTFLSDSGTREAADTKIHVLGTDQELADTTESKKEIQTESLEPERRGPNPRTLG